MERRYIKKAVVVKAEEFDLELFQNNMRANKGLIKGYMAEYVKAGRGGYETIGTGDYVGDGWWITVDENREIHSLSPEPFERTHEPIGI